jgi:elongation factor P hydroxylase
MGNSSVKKENMHYLIENLQKWYMINCNPTWETSFGIVLDTLDNPGWFVKINLSDTILDDHEFEPIKIDKSEHDWIFCKIKENIFDIACGPLNLKDGLQIFFDWQDSIISTNQSKKALEKNDDLIEKLQEWYISNCDEDWEHTYGVRLDTNGTSGWNMKIELSYTILDGCEFETVKVKRSAHDWIFCEVKELVFEIICGPLNLKEGLKIFLDWYESIAFESDDT